MPSDFTCSIWSWLCSFTLSVVRYGESELHRDSHLFNQDCKNERSLSYLKTKESKHCVLHYSFNLCNKDLFQHTLCNKYTSKHMPLPQSQQVFQFWLFFSGLLGMQFVSLLKVSHSFLQPSAIRQPPPAQTQRHQSGPQLLQMLHYILRMKEMQLVSQKCFSSRFRGL